MRSRMTSEMEPAEEYDEGADLGKEIGLLFPENRFPDASREVGVNMSRSGSAPPSVEGSIAGLLGDFAIDEELRADPAYVEYYYTNVNRNPRLPPPVLTREDWRSAQRLQRTGLGGIGDRRRGTRAEDGAAEEEWTAKGDWRDKEGDGLIGLMGLAVRNRTKGLADPFQDKLGCTSQTRCPSRSTNRNAFHNGVETFDSADTQLVHLSNNVPSTECQRSNGNGQITMNVRPIGPSVSPSFASVLGRSLSRNNTSDAQLVTREPSPSLRPVGLKVCDADKKINTSSTSFCSTPSSFPEPADILAALSGINLTRNSMGDDEQLKLKFQDEFRNTEKYIYDTVAEKGVQNMCVQTNEARNLNKIKQLARYSHPDLCSNSDVGDFRKTTLISDRPLDLQRAFVSASDSYLQVPSASPTSVTSPGTSPSHHQNISGANSAFTSFDLGGYGAHSMLPSLLSNHTGSSTTPLLFDNSSAASLMSLGVDSGVLGGLSLGPNALETQNITRLANSSAAAGLQVPLMDPSYLQYLRTAEHPAQLSPNINNSPLDGIYSTGGNSYMDLMELQKAYLGSLLSSQNQYSSMPFLSKCGNSSQGLYGTSNFGIGMSYPGSPLSSPIRTLPGSPGSPLRHGDRNVRLHPSLRNPSGACTTGSWNFDGISNFDGSFGSTLLEEFKSNKAKCLELSDIAGHVFEFSADQYGSRFIQQKLETATNDEKNMVFEEIMPHALSLMTDVFGNYVIQKFFEHGTADQIRELASQLTGHVLTLSLQMYGCRVIQKAIEVINLDQQTKMVAELNGHIMHCVRDQNGNHVIQKCIECIPQNAIQFIISSFFDKVVTLSTHPYGCRVIQRVLEHCDDPNTQKIVMKEIMQCVCMLAQDQYGNYVVQHVLEHGKPDERSAIIKQLAGQIVPMSQQKFASNVVEKCLSFGTQEERQILVNEMLGSTDENEPLQAMMKDQFANYVVQKVLETCDDQQRELILSRIKVHLNALKKYTYGKHIVARVEKLVAAGERRIGIQTQFLS